MIRDWWGRNIDGIEVEMSESLEATMNPLVDVVISTVRIGSRSNRMATIVGREGVSGYTRQSIRAIMTDQLTSL